MRSKGAWLGFGAVVVVAACGGRVGGTAPDGGGTSSGGGGGSSSGGVTTCVAVSTSSFETSCQRDADCTTVTTGNLCPGNCFCGGSSINVASLPAYQSAVAGIEQGACSCPYESAPQCREGTCAVCYGLPSDPPACAGAADASVDARSCVDIPPSSYSTSCSSTEDCAYVPPPGIVCAGSCLCSGVAANQSAQSFFDQATSGMTFGDCPCPPPPGEIACLGGQCVLVTPDAQ